MELLKRHWTNTSHSLSTGVGVVPETCFQLKEQQVHLEKAAVAEWVQNPHQRCRVWNPFRTFCYTVQLSVSSRFIYFVFFMFLFVSFCSLGVGLGEHYPVRQYL